MKNSGRPLSDYNARAQAQIVAALHPNAGINLLLADAERIRQDLGRHSPTEICAALESHYPERLGDIAKAPKKKWTVARTRNGGTWTEAAFWGRLRTELRRVHRFWKPKAAALKAARVAYKTGHAYLCADCQRLFRKEGVEVDHVEPCGSLRCLEDLPGFVARLFIEDPAGYRVRCKNVCHRAKTTAENEARRAAKK